MTEMETRAHCIARLIVEELEGRQHLLALKQCEPEIQAEIWKELEAIVQLELNDLMADLE